MGCNTNKTTDIMRDVYYQKLATMHTADRLTISPHSQMYFNIFPLRRDISIWEWCREHMIDCASIFINPSNNYLMQYSTAKYSQCVILKILCCTVLHRYYPWWLHMTVSSQEDTDHGPVNNIYIYIYIYIVG